MRWRVIAVPAVFYSRSLWLVMLEMTMFFMLQPLSEFAEIHKTARELGLGENIRINLSRATRSSGRNDVYSIDSDKQLELELPSILNGTDRLLRKYN